MSTAVADTHPSLLKLLPLLAERLIAAGQAESGVVVAGICGAQGSGKTTLAHALEGELAARGKRALTLSLDDFYLPRADRMTLGKTIHPLCATRGVPGTHDMALYAATLAALGVATPDTQTPLPVFCKLDDDRLPRTQWAHYTGRPDIVLFEGWCVGARPQGAGAWQGPTNALEAMHDADGTWWRWWNAALAKDYWPLWKTLNPLILIRVPDIESVVQSRLRQEHGLAAGAPDRPTMPNRPIMDEAAVRRFVAHYERLTLRIWDEMPARADIVLDRDDSFVFSMAKPVR